MTDEIEVPKEILDLFPKGKPELLSTVLERIREEAKEDD